MSLVRYDTKASDRKVAPSDEESEAGAVHQAPVLDRSFTRTRTIQLPPEGPLISRTATRIPIHYRTLSIHVYDSQRFEADDERRPHHKPKGSSGGSKLRLPWQKAKPQESGGGGGKSFGSNPEDVDFFSKLDFHTLSAHELCQRLNVAPDVGLDSPAAVKRQQRNGLNVLAKVKTQYWKKLLRYFFGDFCSILWIGVILFFISWKPLGDPPAPYNLALAVLVLIVIFAQAIFSAMQDLSAHRIMNSIMNLLPEDASVLRDGKQMTIPSSELVVGDIVTMSLGQKVPADMRILKCSSDLKFDRAVLTGESEEIAGVADATDGNFLETKNIALLGTHVCNGSFTGIVVLTGSRTVMGRINKLTSSTMEEKTNLQREITRFTYIITVMTVVLITIMVSFWGGFLHHKKPDFLNAAGIVTNCMGLVVAFIPEGLPIAVTMTLSLVAKRMRDARVLPKSLSVVETLGCVSVICSDKTGTLTENKMSVVSIGYVDQQIDHLHESADAVDFSTTSFGLLRRAMALCNDAFFDLSEGSEEKDHSIPLVDRKVKGNATDAALLRYSTSLPGGTTEVTSAWTRAFDIPFNSSNKFAVSYVEPAKGAALKPTDAAGLIVKGAPDILMARCSSYVATVGEKDGAIMPFDDAARAALVARQEAMSRKGQRVIILCQREYSPTSIEKTNDYEEEILEAASQNLTVIGLIGIVDPPRADIPQTVVDCRRAGSRFFMVTGDFYLTAVAIAQQIGILSRQADPDRIADFERLGRFRQLAEVPGRLQYIDGSLVVEGKEIPNITPEQWDVVCKYEEVVFARTTPEQKLRIVSQLRNRDAVVAVTGDGVNDAPALKAANIGIALASGSQVAIEAADLLLMGDFSSIVTGIRLGRLVFQNLQKCISYLLPAGSYSEDWPVLLNVFLGVPLPLSSFLEIIICCFTDLICCLALVFETEEFDLLSEPPRDPKHSHLVGFRTYGQSYLFLGTIETVCAHSMFFYFMYEHTGIPLKGMFLAYSKYTDGYYGNTLANLTLSLNRGQCVYFVCLVMMQMWNLNSVRNKRMSILQSPPLRNWPVLVTPVFSLIVAIFVTEVPGLQNLFGTGSVPIKFWLLPIPLGAGLLLMDEMRKLIVRTFPRSFVAKAAW